MDNLTSSLAQGRDVYAVLTTRTAIYCVIWPIIIVSGILGNVLSLIVIRNTEDSSTTSKFLISLAVADTMNLIVRAAQMVFTWGEIFWPQRYLTWKLSTNAFFVLSLLPDRISKGITVAIVCDRVVALTVPFRYKIICRPLRITAIIVMIYVAMAATTIPNTVDVFAYHFVTGQNRTIYTDMGKQYMASQLSQSTFMRMHVMVNLLVFDTMPIPIVLVCNIIIIVSLRNRNILASATSDVQRQMKLQERQITKLLLTISLLFLALTGPSSVYRFLFVLRMAPADMVTAKLMSDILLTLSLTNCAINFVVYAVMNKKYRERYSAIMCCCRQTNGIEDS